MRVLRTVIRDTSIGVHVTSAARCELEEVRVTGSSGPGIIVSHGSDPVLRRCRTARSTGNGLLVTDRSRGTYEDCWLTGAQMAALRVAGASSPTLTSLTIRDGESDGVLLEEDSAAELERVEIIDVKGTGVVIRGNANPLVRRARITGAAAAAVCRCATADAAGSRTARWRHQAVPARRSRRAATSISPGSGSTTPAARVWRSAARARRRSVTASWSR